ncbi:heparan sulfate 2-O-sulfotransferase hst-2 isoform X2 [Hydra vulgaris]|uniref:heparan sulfate 2-O-sulfotransferase hst-2 isoform X2 n=2 Tax=Hydra vulgaris TaxID=6087 RepID=UPI0006415FE9|nr:heparan sulfate 2-O-sulfotransferase hst-2 isoform X1 [Hydra vulgaris]XP_047144153.1 heparan sulfate 2-O-sulfotransferase hst-2 isoform X1 [Hydra vulgaris]
MNIKIERVNTKMAKIRCIFLIVVLLSAARYLNVFLEIFLPLPRYSRFIDFYNKHISTSNSEKLNKMLKLNFTYDPKLLPRLNETFGKNIFFANITCDEIQPKILLYNRIFKTGSSTIEDLLTRMSSDHWFTLYKFTTEDWYNTGDSFPYPQVIEWKMLDSFNFTAFVAHFFFRKSLRINKEYTYINLVRNPVDRVLSHYYYMRNEKLRREFRILELKQSGEFNESLFDCIQNQHRGCEDNVMTRFFCGPSHYCKTGSFKALQTAKYNIEHHYAVVGTLENINLFIQVARLRLPIFFNHTYVNEIPKIKENKVTRSSSSALITLIRNRNKADSLLYEYAKTRFLKQWEICQTTRRVYV